MKSLKYLNCVEISEYDLIVNSKNEPGRGRLNTLRPLINSDYANYLNNFNSITNLTDSVYVDPDSSLLQGCYSIKTAAKDSLIKRIIAEQTIEFQQVCGYCLYHNVTTIDHYIPKEDYSEFSVLAKNLLPCCSSCNTIKNRFWRSGSMRLFLHLYNDIIPNERFLFGDLIFVNNQPVINFRIDNNNAAINPNLYSTIETHYKRLNLLSLYSKGIAKIISDIQTDVKAIRRAFDHSMPLNKFQDFLLAQAASWKLLYGINYWKAIANDILANSEIFLKSL